MVKKAVAWVSKKVNLIIREHVIFDSLVKIFLLPEVNSGRNSRAESAKSVHFKEVQGVRFGEVLF